MDDVPSQAANASRGECEPASTRDDIRRPANISDSRGIYDLAERFRPIFVAITRGVQAAKPRDVDADEWEDVLGDTLLDALEICDSAPRYFTDIPPRLWAKRAAQYRFMNRKRSKRRRDAREGAFVQEFLQPYYDPDVMNDLLEDDEERRHAFAREWKLLKPRSRSVLEAVYGRDRSYSQAAVELGLSVRIIKREIEETRPRLVLALAEWNPNGARRRGRRPVTDEDRSESRSGSSRAPAPLTPTPGAGDGHV